jgi:clan AA aspartic protease
MGLVMTKVRLTNLIDQRDAKAGRIPEGAIRSVEIEALADTGAICLAIPQDIADRIGAGIVRRTTVTVADGRVIDAAYVGPLDIEVVGRSMTGDALVLPAGTMPLLGAVQMELLDLIVSPPTGEVIPRDPDRIVLPLLRTG